MFLNKNQSSNNDKNSISDEVAQHNKKIIDADTQKELDAWNKKMDKKLRRKKLQRIFFPVALFKRERNIPFFFTVLSTTIFILASIYVFKYIWYMDNQDSSFQHYGRLGFFIFGALGLGYLCISIKGAIRWLNSERRWSAIFILCLDAIIFIVNLISFLLHDWG